MQLRQVPRCLPRGVCIAAIACGCAGEAPSPADPDASEGPRCDETVVPSSDGYHRAGEDCGMCHFQGGSGPPFSFAGTLYTDMSGSAAVAGASLHLTDAMGSDILVTTAGNGNFWSGELLTYPAAIHASSCPDTIAMIAPIGESDGSCNRSGCHTAGFRVHVP
jgi:hypothetical protein